ncbi:uncharacterized protein DS421_11g350150 [Arachis hypogaea]|nr:uncharacterized protein DS421_11g350150 [Arachis hypogaea]
MLQNHRCPACGASGNLDEPRVDAPPMKDVAATGEVPAPLAVAEAVEADDAAGIGSGVWGSSRDAEVGELAEVVRGEGVGRGGVEGGGGGVGAGAEAVEGAADEEEVKEDESGEAKEEEE